MLLLLLPVPGVDLGLRPALVGTCTVVAVGRVLRVSQGRSLRQQQPVRPLGSGLRAARLRAAEAARQGAHGGWAGHVSLLARHCRLVCTWRAGRGLVLCALLPAPAGLGGVGVPLQAQRSVSAGEPGHRAELEGEGRPRSAHLVLLLLPVPRLGGPGLHLRGPRKGCGARGAGCVSAAGSPLSWHTDLRRRLLALAAEADTRTHCREMASLT